MCFFLTDFESMVKFGAIFLNIFTTGILSLKTLTPKQLAPFPPKIFVLKSFWVLPYFGGELPYF